MHDMAVYLRSFPIFVTFIYFLHLNRLTIFQGVTLKTQLSSMVLTLIKSEPHL